MLLLSVYRAAPDGRVSCLRVEIPSMNPTRRFTRRSLGYLALALLACRHPAAAAVGGTDTILAPQRRTQWNPGIPGGIPSMTTICATINAPTSGNGTTDATAAIQSAISACPPGQVVLLPAGTYATSSTLNIDRGIVLRAAGPALSKIKLAPVAGAPVVFIGLWSSYAAPVAVTPPLAKGATAPPARNGPRVEAGRRPPAHPPRRLSHAAR